MTSRVLAFVAAYFLLQVAVAAEQTPSKSPPQAKPAAQQKAATKAVRAFDLDKSHTLDENELAELNKAFAAAPEGPLAALDRDGDQKIDADEAAIVNLGTPRVAGGLKALDVDHDGQIEGDEVAALRAQFEKAKKGPVKALDTNRDGKLDDAEVDALNERLAKQSAHPHGKAATTQGATPAGRHRAKQPAAPAAPPAIRPEDIGTGTAHLSWQPPTQNADGTPLRNLAGFVVRYGRNPDTLNRRVVVDDPRAREYVVDKLGQGKWYFSVSAFAKDGAESSAGKVVSKTIGPD